MKFLTSVVSVLGLLSVPMMVADAGWVGVQGGQIEDVGAGSFVHVTTTTNGAYYLDWSQSYDTNQIKFVGIPSPAGASLNYVSGLSGHVAAIDDQGYFYYDKGWGRNWHQHTQTGDSRGFSDIGSSMTGYVCVVGPHDGDGQGEVFCNTGNAGSMVKMGGGGKLEFIDVAADGMPVGVNGFGAVWQASGTHANPTWTKLADDGYVDVAIGPNGIVIGIKDDYSIIYDVGGANWNMGGGGLRVSM